jgi:hypothetical protein
MGRIGWMALVLGVGCTPGTVAWDEPDADPRADGWAGEDPWEAASTPTEAGTEDLSMYEGASLEVLSPAPGEVLPLEEPARFEAVLRDRSGSALTAQPVVWTSDVDQVWVGEGEAFDDDTLAVGLHAITAQTELPNGDRLAVSVGGVRRQSVNAGTYAGLFSVELDALGLVVTCTGVSTVVVEPLGQRGVGDGDCLMSALGIDLPLAYVYDLEIEQGDVTGLAAVEIFFVEYGWPVTGTLDPIGEGFQLSFAGDVPLLGTLSAFVDAPRVSDAAFGP